MKMNRHDLKQEGSTENRGNIGYNGAMPPLAEKERPRKRVPLTIEMYHTLSEQRTFASDERLELINGEIFEMSPIGSRHARCVKLLNEFLIRHCSENSIISVQDPIELDDHSEPQPDLSILRRTADYYRDALPKAADVKLIIEVSDTSIEFDRSYKVPSYAAAGIPEVWLIDLESEHVEVHSMPSENAYGLVKIYLRGENAVSETFAEFTLPVNDILG